MNNNIINTKVIETYLAENNLSITKFCNLCRISPNTYKKIMTNENCNLIALFRIAKVIDIHICQIFNKA